MQTVKANHDQVWQLKSEWAPQLECLVPSEWNCLGRVKRCGLVVAMLEEVGHGGRWGRVGFVVLKNTLSPPSVSLHAAIISMWISQLLLQYHACLLPTVMVMD